MAGRRLFKAGLALRLGLNQGEAVETPVNSYDHL